MKNTLLLDKSEAIAAFGSPADTAKALGYKTVASVYNWPNTLPLETSDRVRGAWLRLQQVDDPAPHPARRVKRTRWIVGRAA